MSLAGKVALVTGAAQGIGAATAAKLSARGARLALCDIDADRARETARSLPDESAEVFAGDLTDPEFPDALIADVLKHFGSLDIVVNNAGYIWNGAMHNHTDAQWQAMLDMHATAPFRVLRAWAPWLRARAAEERETLGAPQCRKVVNVSSVSGTTGAATQIAYSAGKAAVVGLTKTLAKEWGRYNVTVNAVAFGHIDTRLTQPYSDTPPSIDVGGRSFRVGLSQEQVAGSRAATPLGRTGSPDDAAGAILLFCLPESNFITGEVLTCSGGA